MHLAVDCTGFARLERSLAVHTGVELGHTCHPNLVDHIDVHYYNRCELHCSRDRCCLRCCNSRLVVVAVDRDGERAGMACRVAGYETLNLHRIG